MMLMVDNVFCSPQGTPSLLPYVDSGELAAAKGLSSFPLSSFDVFKKGPYPWNSIPLFVSVVVVCGDLLWRSFCSCT
jgi:hypothetical protein